MAPTLPSLARPSLVAVSLVALVAACSGRVDVTVPDAAPDDTAAPGDAGVAADTGAPMDTGTAPADTGAARADAGVDRPSTDAPATPPGDPAARSRADVCARWSADVTASRGHGSWTAGADACDPGTLPEAVAEDAVRLTNTYRWLAGLPPVPRDPAHDRAAQACSVLQEQNRMLSHNPPMTWRCWSALGAEGASRSNITGGGAAGGPASAIYGWIDDSRDITNTLGHRRWMLFPPLGPIGYGQARSYACLYVLDGRRTGATKPWVAWPNEGYTPTEAMTRIWSFSSGRLGVTSATRVAVTADGAPVAVTAMMRASGYGENTVSWTMPAVNGDVTYHVTVTGLTGAAVEYDVRPVTCGAPR